MCHHIDFCLIRPLGHDTHQLLGARRTNIDPASTSQGSFGGGDRILNIRVVLPGLPVADVEVR